MPASVSNSSQSGRSAMFHLLGVVPWDAVAALQQWLVYEASGSRAARAVVLLCEHPPILTVGRQGSRLDIRGEDAWTRAGHEIRWQNRGGGSLVHAPGQLAVYPIVPLEPFGLSVGAFLDGLQSALERMADDVRFPLSSPTGGAAPRRGLWGRTGQAAFIGVAVKQWVTYQGLFINVDPPLEFVRRAAAVGTVADRDAIGGEASTLSAELRRPVRMPAVRQSIIERLADVWGCGYHVVSGHPNLIGTDRAHAT